MKLFSYVVLRDFGFAPNPFNGYCTLATCKPDIRRVAAIGDIVIGTGTKSKILDGRLIYYMEITEKVTFNEYWEDKKFFDKRPFVRGSLVQMYGDNIYHKFNGIWYQENSHHSYENGTINYRNLNRDTKVDAVLISNKFFYFGKANLKIPTKFNCLYRNLRKHLKIEDEEIITEFSDWLKKNFTYGIIADPISFNSFQRYNGK